MPRPIPLALVAVLAAVTAARVPAQTMADYARCLRAGGDAAVRGAFEQQAQREPGTATGAFAAGCVEYAARRYEAAAKHFERVVAAAPQSGAALTMYGNAAGNYLPSAGMFTKMRVAPRLRDAFAKAVALDGTNVDARYGLMQYLLNAPGAVGGDKAKAREQAEAIARLQPWRGVWARLQVAQGLKDAAYAGRVLAEATVAFPDSSQPWVVLVGQQADAGDAAGAFATVDRWQQARPAMPALQFGIGRAAQGSGQQLERGEAALRAYLVGARRPGDPPVAAAQYRLGLLLQKSGRTEEARLAYREAIRADPAYKPAADALARLD
jgi:tetratricopeptide (TPR) repeat protein